MKRSLVAAGGTLAAGVVASGIVLAASKPARKRLFFSLAVPHGRVGQLLAGAIPNLHRPVYPLVARVLDLQPDDDVLEVACGDGEFLQEHAGHVRSIAGLDLSDVQVSLARRRLRDLIDAGTAQIVEGDAAALPFPDGRFSAVTCMGSLEFFSDPQVALGEMYRVLRPGGRVVITMGWRGDDDKASGGTDALGLWVWNAGDIDRLMEAAGFAEVSVSYGPWGGQESRLVRGVK